jgi:aminopeptidase N
VFAFGEFLKLEGIAVTVLHAPDQNDAARAYADSAEEAERVLADWFGPLKNKPRVVALRDPNAAAFESENLMLAPLRPISNQARQLLLARALVHGSVASPRKWISEGLARFGQALLIERQAGRAAASEYLAQVLPTLIRIERDAGPAAEAAQRAERDSLIHTNDELLYTGKGAYVWWMLRDIAGDTALTKAIAAYRPEQDRDAAYMQQLIEAQSTPRRNWQAFFDSWVYHDYGLPDLRVAAANARLTAENTYVVSVTVENLTRVWVEIQVAVKGANGDVRLARLQVPGNAKSTTRIAFQGTPVMAEVNDGSVPELDFTNNQMPVPPPGQP